MKQIIVISLALLVFAFTAKDLTLYMAFKANQSYISSVLCVNKAKPKTKCKGTCHLKKSISKQKKQSEEFPNIFKESKPITLYVNQIASLNLPKIKKTVQASNSYQHFYMQLYTSDIFRPPQV